MANTNHPQRWRAIDKRTGEWVEGWYVEHHWVEQAGNAVYADARPCIFCDELGERNKGGYWHYIDPATLQPVQQKPQQLSLF